MKTKNRLRSSRGNVLTLMFSVIVVICAVVYLAIALCSLFFIETSMRAAAEQLGIQTAIKLNAGDRIGEINAMTAHSRELVFTSRQTYNVINSHYAHLEPLARLLVEDARTGAHAIDGEHNFLAGEICKEAWKSAVVRSSDMKNRGEVKLSCFKLLPQGVSSLEVGFVPDVPSNAQCPAAIVELADYDRERGYLYQKTEYYKANTSAPLPGEDADLEFRFSSLAPMVEDTASPAHLITRADFEPLMTLNSNVLHRCSKLKTLPSAVRVVTSTKVDAGSLCEAMSSTISASSAGSQRLELTDRQ